MKKKTEKYFKGINIIVATIQQLLVTAAILIGGLWGILEYQYYNNVKLALDFENHKIKILSNNRTTLAAKFRFKSLGNRDISLCLKENQCTSKNKHCEIYKISDKYKIIPINPPTAFSLDVRNKQSARIRGGVSHTFSCLYEISESGWYMVRLYIDVDYGKYDKMIPRSTEIKGWRASEFIYINEKS